MVLARRLSSDKYTLFLLFPALTTDGSQQPIAPAKGDLMPSSGLQRHLDSHDGTQINKTINLQHSSGQEAASKCGRLSAFFLGSTNPSAMFDSEFPQHARSGF